MSQNDLVLSQGATDVHGKKISHCGLRIFWYDLRVHDQSIMVTIDSMTKDVFGRFKKKYSSKILYCSQTNSLETLKWAPPNRREAVLSKKKRAALKYKFVADKCLTDQN